RGRAGPPFPAGSVLHEELRPAGQGAVGEHRGLAGAGCGDPLHRPGPGPALPGRAGIVDEIVPDRAVLDRDDRVRPVLAQPRGAVLADGEPDPGPPAEPAVVTVHRLAGPAAVGPRRTRQRRAG